MPLTARQPPVSYSSPQRAMAAATVRCWGGCGQAPFLRAVPLHVGASERLIISFPPLPPVPPSRPPSAAGIGDNIDATASYPASYASDNVIAVASITSTGDLSSFSNYGRTTVDIGEGADGAGRQERLVALLGVLLRLADTPAPLGLAPSSPEPSTKVIQKDNVVKPQGVQEGESAAPARQLSRCMSNRTPNPILCRRTGQRHPLHRPKLLQTAGCHVLHKRVCQLQRHLE